ncbi:MAG: type II secretion system protein [Patescibacteria group bacterium]|nr:type II secretion system protein [Patescibacteria group bacterium]
MRAFSLIESIISLGIFLIVLSLILSSVMTFSQVSSRYKQIFSFHSLTESIPRILDDLTLISQVEGDYIQLKRNATQWYVE